MKKIFSLLAFAIAFCVNVNAQTTTLWESEDEAGVKVEWGTPCLVLPADEVADANITAGDYIVVTIAGVDPENGWPQVALQKAEGGWPPLANSGVGGQTYPYVVKFPITNDIYETISASGLQVHGDGAYVSKVEHEKGVEISKNTVWFGEKACGWGNGVFIPASTFENIKVGDQIKFWTSDQSFQILVGGWSGLNVPAYDGSFENKTTVDGVTTFTLIDEYTTENTYGENTLNVFELIKANGIGMHGTTTLTRIDYIPAGPTAVSVDVATGEDITAALAAKKEFYNIGDLTINLAGNGANTITGTIEAPASLVIYGNNATIDASALEAPFVTLNGTETWAKQIDAVDEEGNITSSESTSYKYIENVNILDVTITGLKKALVRDNQKTYVESVFVKNSNIEIVGGPSIIDFSGKGYPANLDVSNSTLWSKDGHGGFFTQLQNRLGDIDKTKKVYTETIAVKNCTFYNISYGKKMNNLNQKGQTWLTFILKNSIFYNVSTADPLNGWNGGQDSTNPTMVYENNTYWSTDGAVAVWTDNTKNSSDKTETALATDPGFVDAANGDFTISAASEQAKFQTGDPRWLVEYDEELATGINNVAVENASNGVIFNLAGQKVSESYKGIVIKNGKKVLVK